mmetsp:Transcript_17895/g.19950  ORF Transcript_17895/g.19950 Transcript_17895/m.19950 type:complete len:473 (-) Transcript_17895:69-1487(-)
MAPCWVMPSSALKAGGRTSTFCKSFRRFLSTTHSQRGKRAVTLLPDYLADARAVVKYSASAPDGALQLGVAENQMLEDLLVPALTKFSSSKRFAADCIYYQPTHGRYELREAFCKYLQRLLNLSTDLDREALIMGAGCNAVLENLCITLAAPGEGVLIPTPYYAAFEFDLVARAGLSIIPVNTFDESGVDICGDYIPREAYYPTKSSLNKSLAVARQEGQSPRILLLSHPNNPLGICYPSNIIQDCIDWCRENQIHLVSDEIYAGSVYRSNDFQSTLKLVGPGNLGPYIHFVYALSKDFALSGLRIGACYSENSEIRLGLHKLNDLCQISSQTQTLVETMVSDITKGVFWTSSFLKENTSRIQFRSDAIQALLSEFDIPFLHADSGLFLWIDLSRYLSNLKSDEVAGDLDSMQRRERELYLELMNKWGLLFTPGLSMRHEKPGFFRCVFTAATDREYEVALDRLRKFAEAKN